MLASFQRQDVLAPNIAGPADIGHRNAHFTDRLASGGSKTAGLQNIARSVHCFNTLFLRNTLPSLSAVSLFQSCFFTSEKTVDWILGRCAVQPPPNVLCVCPRSWMSWALPVSWLAGKQQAVQRWMTAAGRRCRLGRATLQQCRA